MKRVWRSQTETSFIKSDDIVIINLLNNLFRLKIYTNKWIYNYSILSNILGKNIDGFLKLAYVKRLKYLLSLKTFCFLTVAWVGVGFELILLLICIYIYLLWGKTFWPNSWSKISWWIKCRIHHFYATIWIFSFLRYESITHQKTMNFIGLSLIIFLYKKIQLCFNSFSM